MRRLKPKRKRLVSKNTCNYCIKLLFLDTVSQISDFQVIWQVFSFTSSIQTPSLTSDISIDEYIRKTGSLRNNVEKKIQVKKNGFHGILNIHVHGRDLRNIILVLLLK